MKLAVDGAGSAYGEPFMKPGVPVVDPYLLYGGSKFFVQDEVELSFLKFIVIFGRLVQSQTQPGTTSAITQKSNADRFLGCIFVSHLFQQGFPGALGNNDFHQ